MMIVSCAKVVDQKTQLSQTAGELLYLIQDSVPDLSKFDTGYIQSQKAEFNVFMATLE